ncbi:MAG: 6-bladed beta-propeller [Marinifilaceae bacterium]
MKRLLIIVCIFSWSIVVAQDKEIIDLDLENKLENTEFIDLNNLSNDISIVPLETSLDCLLGKINKLIKLDDYILVSGSENKVLLFDLHGKFIRQIGKQGRGPGEYVYLSSFSYSRKDKLVYVNSIGQVLKYSLEGKFIEKLKLPSPFMQTLTVTDNNSLCYVYPYSGTRENKDSLDFVSILSSKAKKLIDIKSGITSPPTLVYYNWIYSKCNNVYFKEEFGDMIYLLDEKLKVTPVIKLGLGKKSFKPKHLDISLEREWQKYYRINGMFDVSDFYIINIQKGLVDNNLIPLFYNRKSKKMIISKGENGKIGLWWSGVKWNIIASSNNELVMCAEAIDIIDSKESKNGQLRHTLDVITEESNPILVFAKIN